MVKYNTLKLFSVSFFIFSFSFIATPVMAQQQSPDSANAKIIGNWQGTLAGRLTVIFHIKRDNHGVLTATMDSPEQGTTGISVNSVSFKGDSLYMTISAIGGKFKGKISENSQTIEGTWIQRGQFIPLTLERMTEGQTITLKRPQTPEPPFPYKSIEVTFQNEKADITIAGTLTLPDGQAPYPAVVLISGSGPQTRNSVVAGHKLFWVLADYLTRRGIAVLRYDERGTGESTGTFAGATTRDFAKDVQAAVDFLKNRNNINKIGLLGWSEGAIVAPMVAARSHIPAFLVLIGAPAVTGEELIYEQVERIARAQGSSPITLDSMLTRQRRLLSTVVQAPDSAVAAKQLHQLLEKMEMPNNKIKPTIKKLTSPWFRFFLSYNPRQPLRKVKAPVLAIYGTKDLQVPPEQNVEPLKKSLKNNHNVTVKVLNGLNHLLQPAQTGLPSEYSKIKVTIAPKALDLIGDWITKHTAIENNH